MAKIIEVKSTFESYDNQSELKPAEVALLKAAQEATQQSYAPYSGFLVGAAILLEDNTIIKGANQENAAYPSGMCAERTAIFYTGATYPDKKILAIAISARHNNKSDFLQVSPCGSCRQSMLEYETRQATPIRFIMQGNDNKIYVAGSIASLLPFCFTEQHLLDQ